MIGVADRQHHMLTGNIYSFSGINMEYLCLYSAYPVFKFQVIVLPYPLLCKIHKEYPRRKVAAFPPCLASCTSAMRHIETHRQQATKQS